MRPRESKGEMCRLYVFAFWFYLSVYVKEEPKPMQVQLYFDI